MEQVDRVGGISGGRNPTDGFIVNEKATMYSDGRSSEASKYR